MSQDPSSSASREAGFCEGGRWRQFYGPTAVTDVTRRSSERILHELSSHVVASLRTMSRLVLWEVGGCRAKSESHPPLAGRAPAASGDMDAE